MKHPYPTQLRVTQRLACYRLYAAGFNEDEIAQAIADGKFPRLTRRLRHEARGPSDGQEWKECHLLLDLLRLVEEVRRLWTSEKFTDAADLMTDFGRLLARLRFAEAVTKPQVESANSTNKTRTGKKDVFFAKAKEIERVLKPSFPTLEKEDLWKITCVAIIDEAIETVNPQKQLGADKPDQEAAAIKAARDGFTAWRTFETQYRLDP